MANPAELLHATLTRWRTNRTGYADPTEQRIAIGHLDSIAELLNQMDDAKLKTDVFRRHFDKWVDLTLHHPHAWQTQDPQKLIDTSALDHLENLGEWFRNLVPAVKDGGLDEIRAYADAVLELLDEDDSIDPLLTRHARQVVVHLLWCIDNYDSAGDFDLQEAVERLLAVMVRTASTSTRRDRWRDLLNGFVYPFAVNVAAAIPAQAVVQLALGG